MKLPFTDPPLRDRGLRFKLTLIMLILFVFSLGSVFVPYYMGREALRREIEKSFLELSNAISVSVEQLTTTGLSEEDRLQHYVESLKKSGIREVSIVEEEMGVIDSTNPKAIGRPARIKLPSKPLVITASFGDDTGEKIQSKHLVIPMKVGGESLGYMHARFQIDDFTEPIRKNLYLRILHHAPDLLPRASPGGQHRFPLRVARWSGWRTPRKGWRRGTSRRSFPWRGRTRWAG